MYVEAGGKTFNTHFFYRDQQDGSIHFIMCDRYTK